MILCIIVIGSAHPPPCSLGVLLGSSKTTMWCHNSEDHSLTFSHCKKLKYHKMFLFHGYVSFVTVGVTHLGYWVLVVSSYLVSQVQLIVM